MKKTLALILGLILSINSFSQSYFTAGGARFGTDWGMTIQQKVLKHTTVEGIFQSSLFREELMLTVMPEYHFPLITKRLNLYAGAGFHKGFVTDNLAEYESPYGISVVGGAEFTFARFVFSYDYKPAFNISGGEHSWYSQSAVSVRYVFVKQNAFKKMKRKNERQRNQKDRQKRREDFFDRN